MPSAPCPLHWDSCSLGMSSNLEDLLEALSSGQEPAELLERAQAPSPPPPWAAPPAAPWLSGSCERPEAGGQLPPPLPPSGAPAAAGSPCWPSLPVPQAQAPASAQACALAPLHSEAAGALLTVSSLSLHSSLEAVPPPFAVANTGPAFGGPLFCGMPAYQGVGAPGIEGGCSWAAPLWGSPFR